MPSFKYEKNLKKKGFILIAGVDEVGCGPLAGPIVAAAVILPDDFKLKGLRDSKLLSAEKREELFPRIKKAAICIGIARLNHRIIDRINIRQANLLVMKMAVENLKIRPDYLLLDGAKYKIALSLPQRGISGGDRKCASIAAASIIAKVTRDRLMQAYHIKYPLYAFDRHKGYGTKLHYQRLKTHGPCAIHRRSFSLTSAD